MVEHITPIDDRISRLTKRVTFWFTITLSDYEAEMLRVKHSTPSEYRLPDGSPLNLDQSDLFRCTEPLFQPEIAGIMNQSGVANLIMESLQR